MGYPENDHKPQVRPGLTDRLFDLVSKMSEEQQADLLKYLSQKTRKFDRKTCVLTVDCEVRGSTSLDYALDISRGGVFIETTRILDLGEKVRLSLSFRALNKNLKVTGKVVWKSIHGAGIEFDKLTPQQDMVLETLLDTL